MTERHYIVDRDTSHAYVPCAFPTAADAATERARLLQDHDATSPWHARLVVRRLDVDGAIQIRPGRGRPRKAA